jgi:hypothetical protein
MDLRRPWDAEKQRLEELAETRPATAQIIEEELAEIEKHVKNELGNRRKEIHRKSHLYKAEPASGGVRVVHGWPKALDV